MRVRLHNDDWGYESNCFVCEVRNAGGLRIPFFHDTEADQVVAEFSLDHTYSGAPTLLHGGVQLALLDEAMAWATIAIAHQWALTSTSSSEFIAPVMVDAPHEVWAQVDAVDGDRIEASGRIIDVAGRECTRARATFQAIGEAVAVRALGAAMREEHRGYLAGEGPDG